ncbi:MAG: DeoR/GlpR family DNA-binding transcription regulator, partial [Candidatus Bipolaricaulota bacterium]|nr:DeoR/GlpR family DNA-binding transcription regulator [Candidatus Bipolaricaulota bacterium]
TFAVSSMTIRNDLNYLAEQGQLVRVHGGAIARQWLTTEPSYHDKASINHLEKENIGRRAATLVEEGMAVFIGNGTTTMEIIKHLPQDKRFRVFTNALNHALEVNQIPQAEVFVLGGHLREVSLAMVGRLAHQALKGIYFDLAFLGVNGISIDRGLTIPSLEEAEVAAEIIERSQRKIIVADHAKFGIVAHGKIADITDIDAIITDSGLDPRLLNSLSNLDVEINTVTV